MNIQNFQSVTISHIKGKMFGFQPFGNQVAKYSNYEKSIATDDLDWVENYLISAYDWFPNDEILDYIIENKDYFDDIEIVGCGA